MVTMLAKDRIPASRSSKLKNNGSLRLFYVVMLSGIIAATLPLSDAMAQVVNLNGDWSSQYTCPSGQTLPLVLRISQYGQQISAKTIAADVCLQANTQAFDGVLYGNTGNLHCGEIYDPNPSSLNPNDNSQSVGDFFAQALVEAMADGQGGPGRYAVRYSPGTIQVISSTSFVACTLVFTRAGTAPPAGVAPIPAPLQQTVNAASSGPMQFYCSHDGSSYAKRKGGIQCPGPRGTAPICPHGFACTCIDGDGSCTDGDDDWGYRPPAVQPAYVYPPAVQPPGAYPNSTAGPATGNYNYPATAQPPGAYPYPAAGQAQGNDTYPAAPPGAYPNPAAAQQSRPQDSLTRIGREQWQQYLQAPDNKAFALSRSSGSFGWRRGRKSIEDAKEGAIAACKTADCEVISVNAKK